MHVMLMLASVYFKYLKCCSSVSVYLFKNTAKTKQKRRQYFFLYLVVWFEKKRIETHMAPYRTLTQNLLLKRLTEENVSVRHIQGEGGRGKVAEDKKKKDYMENTERGL